MKFQREQENIDLVDIIYFSRLDWEVPSSREEIKKRIFGTRRSFLVARDAQPFAFSVWTPETKTAGPRPECGPHSADLSIFVMHPRLWGRPFVEKLLEKTFQEMKEEGFRDARLWTPASATRARMFYDRHGFALRRKLLLCGTLFLELVSNLETQSEAHISF